MLKLEIVLTDEAEKAYDNVRIQSGLNDTPLVDYVNSLFQQQIEGVLIQQKEVRHREIAAKLEQVDEVTKEQVATLLDTAIAAKG